MVLYHKTAPSTFAAAQNQWNSNTSTGTNVTFIDQVSGQSYPVSLFYNNRNSAGEGLPEGETMTFVIRDLALNTATYGEMELTFQYVKFDHYMDISSVEDFRVYASTDNGATWSANWAKMKSQHVKTIGTNSGGTEGRLYDVVSTDLTGLVNDGSTINALKIMPYGTYSAMQYHTAVRAISVTGYKDKAPKADKIEYIYVDEDVLRQIVVDHAYQVALTPWHADTEIQTWNGYSDDNPPSAIQYYKPGRLYLGPTYSRGPNSTLDMWRNVIQADGKYVGGTDDTRNNWTVIGWDCINVVAEAWSLITTSRSYSAHLYLYGSETMPLLGGMENKERVRNEWAVLSQYPEQQVYEAYAELKIGDHIHSTGHSRLVTVAPTVVRKSDGTIDPMRSALAFTETAGTIQYYYMSPAGKIVTSTTKDVDAYLADHAGYTYLYGSSMRVDRAMTFDELLNNENEISRYQAYTLKEFKEGRVEKQRVHVITDVTAANVVSNGFAVIVESNYHINKLTTVLADSAGKVLYEKTKYGEIHELEQSTYDEELNSLLKNLNAGSYKLTVDVTSGPVTRVMGKIPTQRVFELDFTA